MPADPTWSPNQERRLASARRRPEFLAGQVQRAVEGLSGQKVIHPPVFLPGGLGNENWQVETLAGPLLCKIGPPDAPLAKWRAAGRGAQQAMEAGLLVPQCVAINPACEALDGRPVRLFRHIPGCTLDDLGGVQAVGVRFWQQLGQALRRLHSIEQAAFCSRLDFSVPSFATWDAYLSQRIPQVLQRLETTGYLPGPAAARFFDALLAEAHTIAAAIRPALTHRDLHPDNLLVSAEGGLAAILDWDQAEAWDPVVDFFKLQWLIFEDVPQAWPVFSAAYCGADDGAICGLETVYPHYPLRLNIACAVELANTLAGCLPEETLAVAHVQRRLQALARAAGWPDPSA